jgi:general secretion pathway protein C
MKRLARQFWVIDLAFLAAVAWMAAGTAAAVLEHALSELPPAAAARRKAHHPPPGPPLPRLEASRLAALTGLPMPIGPEPPPAPEFDPSVAPVATTLPLRLLGTMIAQRAEWTLAAIEDLQSREWRSYAEGDSLGRARVLAIERERVMLLVDGHREYLEMRTLPARGTPPPVLASTLKNAPPTPPASSGAGIRALDENTYDVARSEVDHALSHLNELAMQARTLPAFRDGKAVGFKLFSIRPGSLYTRIGVQNGDVIRRINGFDLDSPEKALEAYTRLKNASRIDIELERGRQVVRKTYYIR